MFYPQVFWVVWASSRKAKSGVYGSSGWVESSLDILKAIENVGITVEMSGMGNISRFEGPAVFIGNHMSTLETFVLPSVIEPIKEVTFVVKRSLVDMPVFGHVMRSREPIIINRVNPREDLKTVLEEGSKKIKSGTSLIIFPQNTRSVVFNPEDFNSLGIKLALKAGVPAVPVAVKTDAWGIGKFIKDIGRIDNKKKVHFTFGEPMKIEGRGREEHEKVIKFIKENLDKWNKGDSNEYKQ
jgi:1-acyl-sn-glycerol-3-phosphate acyltransferase